MKKVKTIIKLNLKAGEATPAPPVGPALGQHGINIVQFCQEYNKRTQDKKGEVIPAVITVYKDKSFYFVTKLPPIAEFVKKKLKLEKASGEPGKETVGELTEKDLEEIAKEKMPDLNTQDLEQAKKIVAGTARSMGVKVISNIKN